METPMEIKFYYDYKSPFAYLCFAPACALEQEYRVKLRFIPYELDIPGTFGEVEARSERNWRKVRYLYLDARRFAKERGVLLRGPQKVFDSRMALISGLYAEHQGRFRPYSERVFERFFRRELDLEDRSVLEATMAEVGINPAGFKAFLENEGVKEFEQCAAEADRDEIFGVPTLIVDGEPFWGNDRLDWVRRKLDQLGLRR